MRKPSGNSPKTPPPCEASTRTNKFRYCTITLLSPPQKPTPPTPLSINRSRPFIPSQSRVLFRIKKKQSTGHTNPSPTPQPQGSNRLPLSIKQTSSSPSPPSSPQPLRFHSPPSPGVVLHRTRRLPNHGGRTPSSPPSPPVGFGSLLLFLRRARPPLAVRENDGGTGAAFGGDRPPAAR